MASKRSDGDRIIQSVRDLVFPKDFEDTVIIGKPKSDPLTQDFHRCGHCGAGYFQRSTNRESVRCPACDGVNSWRGGAVLQIDIRGKSATGKTTS